MLIFERGQEAAYQCGLEQLEFVELLGATCKKDQIGRGVQWWGWWGCFIWCGGRGRRSKVPQGTHQADSE
jgi:hypothetical protein